MVTIGLIADTHGAISRRTLNFLSQVDEVWHAGDIGSVSLADHLAQFKPLRAVYGNIDDHRLRRMFPENLRFFSEEVDVLMTHIGGYPGHYAPSVRKEIYAHPPRLFICGHSHILRVIYDKKINCLCMNPGASGNQGFHNLCTAIRFRIDGLNISGLEVLEFQRSDFLLNPE